MTKTKSNPNFQDLLDMCDESIAMSKEVEDWDKMPAVGKEYGNDENRNSEVEKLKEVEQLYLKSEKTRRNQN